MSNLCDDQNSINNFENCQAYKKYNNANRLLNVEYINATYQGYRLLKINGQPGEILIWKLITDNAVGII